MRAEPTCILLSCQPDDAAEGPVDADEGPNDAAEGPDDAVEGPTGAVEGARSQETELEGEGENPASISAPERLPTSLQPSSTASRVSSESSGRTEEPESLPRRSRRASSTRPRTQSLEGGVEAASWRDGAGIQDLVALARERADKELAIAQQKADQELAIAEKRAKMDQKIDVMIRLKNDMGFSLEQCEEFLRKNEL
jgi:hypothetical protein